MAARTSTVKVLFGGTEADPCGGPEVGRIQTAESLRHPPGGFRLGDPDRHPTGGAEQFAARADRHLDMLGITGDLWELARRAVRATLVWQVPGAELAARVVYRPFQDAIPYLRIQ